MCGVLNSKEDKKTKRKGWEGGLTITKNICEEL